MKNIVLAVSLALAMGSYAYAKDEAPVAKKELTPQQQKMKDCNADAGSKGLKGDERKKFMKECLGHKSAAKSEKRTAQQNKMKACNKEAGEKQLKGPDRKKFMNECLKASPQQ